MDPKIEKIIPSLEKFLDAKFITTSLSNNILLLMKEGTDIQIRIRFGRKTIAINIKRCERYIYDRKRNAWAIH